MYLPCMCVFGRHWLAHCSISNVFRDSFNKLIVLKMIIPMFEPGTRFLLSSFVGGMSCVLVFLCILGAVMYVCMPNKDIFENKQLNITESSSLFL